MRRKGVAAVLPYLSPTSWRKRSRLGRSAALRAQGHMWHVPLAAWTRRAEVEARLRSWVVFAGMWRGLTMERMTPAM